MEQSTDLERMWQYIAGYHVLTLCTHNPFGSWAANLFYATDAINQCLYVLTSENTRHGTMMQANPSISGTISDQQADVSQLRGLQFRATITRLTGDEENLGRDCYEGRFPIAKKMKETVWKISFTELKLTDNTAGFGTKYNWRSI